MKKIAWIIGGVGLLGSLGYLFSYVIRWQWNRALFSGLAFLSLLVALGIAAVLRKLGQMERQLQDGSGGGVPEDVLRALEDTRPRRNHFAWLTDTSRTNVFITLLLGGGVVVSGIAWVVGRIAEGSVTPAAERRLAEKLGPLALPERGVGPVTDPALDPAERLLRRPQASTGAIGG